MNANHVKNTLSCGLVHLGRGPGPRCPVVDVVLLAAGGPALEAGGEQEAVLRGKGKRGNWSASSSLNWKRTVRVVRICLFV